MSRPACKIEGCDNQAADAAGVTSTGSAGGSTATPTSCCPRDGQGNTRPSVRSTAAKASITRTATAADTQQGSSSWATRWHRHASRPAAHKRISRALGPASRFVCVQCSEPAHEWSYDGGDPDELTTSDSPRDEHPGLAYSLNPDYYSPRCRPCHRRRDLSLVRPRDAAGRFTTVDAFAPRTERTQP